METVTVPKQDLKKNATKKSFWESQVGILKQKGDSKKVDSVKEIRKIRWILSKQKIDLDEINNL